MSDKPQPKYTGELLHWRRHGSYKLRRFSTSDITHYSVDEFFIAQGSGEYLWWNGISRDEFMELSFKLSPKGARRG